MFLALFFCLLLSVQCDEINKQNEIVYKLNKVLNFVASHYAEINFDGALGLTIAEAQLRQIIQCTGPSSRLLYLIQKCAKTRRLIELSLPIKPTKMVVLKKYLLNSHDWIINSNFTYGKLQNLGIYKNWTAADILSDRTATYKQIPSDFCLMQILAQNCYVSSFCREMMLSSRIDKGYLLTHRIFYLQVMRLKKCDIKTNAFETLKRQYCSLILKELKTNEYLGFAAHDIALEQIVLCGIEGYTEFFSAFWMEQIETWQDPLGCFQSANHFSSRRTSNLIEDGCSDHTTGLGAATLALYLRYLTCT